MIPKEFKPIAVRDDRLGISVISYNQETKEFYLFVNGKESGPLKLNDLKTLKENINDVIGLKGRFIFIESYNANGELID